MFKRIRYTFGRITPKGVRKSSAIYKDPFIKRGRGCLCENGTYSSHCCDGSIQGQGIGDINVIVACLDTYYENTYYDCDYYE